MITPAPQLASLPDVAANGGKAPISLGGTNATTAAAARVALGLEIGVDVQAFGGALSGVLDFPAGSAQSLACGDFWPAATNLGNCFYRAVCMPRDSGGGYLFSDGEGGAHAVLLGFSQSGAGAVNLITGNVNGTPGTSYTAFDGLYPNEWGEIAWGWDGSFFYAYVNGVPVMKTAYAGTRQSPAVVAGAAGPLYIGGSTHSNYNGRLAAAQAYEGSFPLTTPSNAYSASWPLTPYAGPTYLSTGTWVPCNGLWETTVPGRYLIPDMSPVGQVDNSGVARFHPGFLWGSTTSAGKGFVQMGASSYPRPWYVYDSSFPYISGSTTPTPPAYAGPTTPSLPASAKLFHSFTDANSTYAWDAAPSLGSTDSRASLGSVAWSTGNPASASAAVWGKLHGAAVFLDTNVRSVAWVNGNSGDMDVRVDRVISTSGVGNRLGLCFRTTDRQNFWYALADGGTSGTDQVIRVGSWVAGVNNYESGNGSSATNWTTLRVVTSGTTITAYVDNGSGGWTQVLQVTGKTDLQTAVGAGLYTPTFTGTPGVTGLVRYKNFTVL